MAASRYIARRWCASCQRETELDLVVEDDVILTQCLTCLTCVTLPRIDPAAVSVREATR